MTVDEIIAGLQSRMVQRIRDCLTCKFSIHLRNYFRKKSYGILKCPKYLKSSSAKLISSYCWDVFECKLCRILLSEEQCKKR